MFSWSIFRVPRVQAEEKAEAGGAKEKGRETQGRDEGKEKGVPKIVIVGGGTGGLVVASLLNRGLSSKDIVIIEPSEKHYYQPLWTLVGAGIYDKKKSEGEEKDFIPKGAKWVKEAVKEFVPQDNLVRTASGSDVHYDYLVVATGVVPYWDRVKGLPEALGKNGVCSNYSYQTVDKTWQFLQEFKKGQTAIFTFPNTPVKCGGGPQKIMWLAEDYLRNKVNKREGSTIFYCTAGASMFAVKQFSDILAKMTKERGVDVKYGANLIEVRGEAKEAVFQTSTGPQVLKYDFLHVTPPMGPVEAVRTSPLADSAGFVDVDKHTLQHKKYPNVFSLGDTSNLPTSKTAAAISTQAPVLASNLVSSIKKMPLAAKYDGYTSCPIVTTYKTVLLAEFLYDGVVVQSTPFNQLKESRFAYLLKCKLFPAVYWNLMLQGRWFGPKTLFNPHPVSN
eukprot:Phypoly_transcript_08492.p1 GENE.Phypoly_transcript_08492~~Phypoly_transcript_08492.p1  ORF type:complete len:447 (-),score=77.12 Phypoly_transcript_08492:48-1388(-)